MIDLTIDLTDAKGGPLYEQIYRHIVREIRAGRLREGEKLPSKRELCAHLKVSRSTVETAYELLVAEGYVRSVPRSGLYVNAVAALGEYVRGDAPKPTASKAEKPAERYVFSTGAVDTSIFPYALWSRLSKEAMQLGPELLRRGDGQGDEPLRAVLCEFLRQYRGVVCEPEQIIIGAGMDYLLDLAMKLLDEKALYGLEDPGYGATYRTIAANRGQMVPIPLDKDGLSIAALKASQADIAYVTPSHQFPMGVTMPVGRRSQLLKWAEEKENRYVIEDDYDSEFRYATRPIPAMQGLDHGGKVIYIGTFSRTIAPSIRIAYLVLPETLLRRYQSALRATPSTVSRFEQRTLYRFIETGAYARHLRRVGNLYRQRCALLVDRLRAIDGVSIRGHEAGLHFLLTLDRYSERELIAKAAAVGVKLHGLSEYARGRPPLESTLVLGYAGMTEEAIEEATELLGRAWGGS